MKTGLMILAAVGLLTACSNSTTPTVSVSSASSSPPTVAAVVAPTSAAPADIATALQTWFFGPAADAWKAWGADITNAQTAENGGDPAQVDAACAKLSVDTLKFEAVLPSPDPITTREMTAAAEDSLAASASCSVGDFVTSDAKFTSAAAHLSIATARITQLSGG
jgi:hypothetical protein